MSFVSGAASLVAVDVLFAAVGDKPTYLMFTQGMSIMQVPFNPSAAEPGKQTLLIPGKTRTVLASPAGEADVMTLLGYALWT